MKKKLVLVIAVVLIAITACACLVGCVPNRPDKYIGTWITSKNKALVVDGGSAGITEFGINGKKMQMKIKIGEAETIVIFEEKGDKLNMYVKLPLLAWKATSITVEDAKKDENGQWYEQIKNAFDSEDVKAMCEQIQKDFTENFEEKDGWWTAKATDSDFGALKVDGNDLKVKTGNKESTAMKLNYKITIPSEAKAALNK